MAALASFYSPGGGHFVYRLKAENIKGILLTRNFVIKK